MTRLSVFWRRFAQAGGPSAFMTPLSVIRTWLASLAFCLVPSLAQASDDALAALAERGFVPWASDFVGEFPILGGPSSNELVLGSGFLIRLPRPTNATQFLVINGPRSVIVDRIGEVGPVGVSAQAADALGLLRSSPDRPVKVQIVALLRQTAAASASSAPLTAPPPPPPPAAKTASTPALALPPLVMVDEALSEPVLPPPGTAAPAGVPEPGREPSEQTSFSLRFEPVGSGFASLGDGLPGDGEVLSFRASEEPQAAPPAAPPIELQAPKPVPSVVTPPARPVASTARPGGQFALQAGFFRVQDNAGRLAARLRDQGLPVIERQTRGQNGAGWLVLVGPFASTGERDRAKSRGGALLKDAFPVRAPRG